MGLVKFAFVNKTIVAGKLGNLHFWRENIRGARGHASYRQIDIPARTTETLSVKTCCRINHLPGQFKLHQSMTASAAL